jgi:hypothetical protein
MEIESHFFTNKIIKSYSNKISVNLKQNNLVIMNLTGIYHNIIEPYGTLTATSTNIGSRKTQKRKADYIYEDDPEYPNKYYGGVGTPVLPTSSKSKSKSESKSETKTNKKTKKIRFTLNTPPRESRKKEIINKINKNILEIIMNLTDATCKGKINKDYGIKSVKKGINQEGIDPDTYDIVVIANRSIVNKKNITNKLQDIYGMMVVQKGECIKFPEIYAINLICANREGISKFLLGLYLYTIKKTPKISQWGILELADKYNNIAGYCAYQKFGFQHDPDLINNCFPDNAKDNLPMIVDIDMFTTENIISIVTDKLKIPKDNLCTITNKELQKKIAIYQNIEYTLKNQTDYSFLHDFFKKKRKYIDQMYSELGLEPDYFVRSKFEPKNVIKHIENYITILYPSETTK